MSPVLPALSVSVYSTGYHSTERGAAWLAH